MRTTALVRVLLVLSAALMLFGGLENSLNLDRMGDMLLLSLPWLLLFTGFLREKLSSLYIVLAVLSVSLYFLGVLAQMLIRGF